MKINIVTITGSDDRVSPEDLIDLTNKYPFVEWGILFSSKGSKPRYPSAGWINEIVKYNLPLSAHFCGWWSRQVLIEKNYYLLSTLHPSFKRVQLNFNFDKTEGWDLESFFEYVKFNPNRDYIIQYNSNNSKYIEKYKEKAPYNVNFIYDASGGRGKEIESIEDPIMGPLGAYYTGYAGGIHQGNVENICQMIKNKDVGDPFSFTWIDLESGARTNNGFDLEKVTNILEISSKYVTKFYTIEE